MYFLFFRDNFKISKSNVLGILLGIAAGTGHATSLRFSGFAGLSEILFLMIALYLFYKSPRFFLKKKIFFEFVIRSYLLFSVILVLPLVTIVVYSFLDKVSTSAPIYIFNFILGIGLMFLIVESIRANLINFRSASLVFLITFMTMNICAIFLGINNYDQVRYTGFSNNPNQIVFYISYLMLMLAIYRRKTLFISLPFLAYLGIETGSDAFLVFIAGIIFIFFFLSIFNFIKVHFFFCLSVMFIFLITLSTLIIYIYQEELVAFLKSADDKNLVRLNLMYNAFVVTLKSPLIGWGAGSFSGISFPFEGSEAHNNFLDFSMQFGVIVPFILYYIILAALVKSIKNRDPLLASIIAGFFIISLFHFSGRHFSFWLQVGFLFQYLYPGLKNFKVNPSQEKLILGGK
jgi:hypothetical protein